MAQEVSKLLVKAKLTQFSAPEDRRDIHYWPTRCGELTELVWELARVLEQVSKDRDYCKANLRKLP